MWKYKGIFYIVFFENLRFKKSGESNEQIIDSSECGGFTVTNFLN